MKLKHWLRGLAIFVLLAMCVGANPARLIAQAVTPVGQGQLVTSSGERVNGTELRSLLDKYVPEGSAQSRLLILTQCYGGNMTSALTSGTTKTTVLSATSTGQKAVYGGYDDNAASALRPGAGRTSNDIHNAGINGKAASETPNSSGPGASLEPVNPSGPIKSRHILIYAGSPDSSPGRDISQRDEIIKNFKDQPAPTTTVTTVGGPSDNTNGWNYAGTKDGLTKALIDINGRMNENEQFIMFVTDHGSLQAIAVPTCDGVQNKCDAQVSFDPLSIPQMIEDINNQPALTLFSEGMIEPPVVDVEICPTGAIDCLQLENLPFVPFDLHGDGDLNDPGDGWMLDIPLAEPFALSGMPINVSAMADPSGSPLLLNRAGLETGAIAKGMEETAAQPHATLSTSSGPSIYDDQLRAMLDEYIPESNAHSTLLVFTQCFGGDMLDDFAGRANTGAISATSAGGEEAEYGGYHDNAAEALYPGAGRTSADVHAAGTAGKHPDEHPISVGAPVSLQPVNPGTKPTGITSRHVLFYAGEAGELSGADIADRDKVVANFPGAPTTTVTTVGFGGGEGWNHPGTLDGLRAALQEIQAKMGPGEQFIMFVGDHGNYDMVDDTPVCEGDGTCASEPFVLPGSVQEAMANDADNVPGVLVVSQVPVPDPVHITACDSFFDICYEIDMRLDFPIDLDGNGLVDKPGEGFMGRMDLPEEFILGADGVMVRVQNPSGIPLILRRVSLESGEISRGYPRIFLPLISR